MKTRRFLRPFSAFVFSLVLACTAFAFAACDTDDNDKDNKTDTAETFYKVTLDFDGTLGSVTASDPADSKGYAPDEQVTVTFAPNAGYTVSSVKVNDADVTFTGDSYSFAVKGDTTVKVGFSVAHYQVTVTSPAAAEGTLSVSEPASESGYVLGEKVTVTVEANAGYYVTAVKVNGTAIDAVEGEYSFTVAGATTVSAEFGAFADALSGKTYYSFAAAYGYTFQSGKATALATGAEAVDYAFTSDNTAVLKAEEEDVSIVLNDDGTLLVGDDTYFVVGEELTVSVKESGTDVDVVFTVERVDVTDDGIGMGDSYTVVFGNTYTYGGKACNSIENYADELTLTYAETPYSYKVTVDLTALTAKKALSGVSLLTEGDDYRLDISTDGANRFADFYKKDGNSFKQVGSSLARKSREVDDGEFEYYWEANETAGDVTTVYTIVITGAKWRDPASLDDYSDAKITVTKSEQGTKTLTAQGNDNTNYEVKITVKGSDITIDSIKKGTSTLYNPQYNQHAKSESLVKVNDTTFKYSYAVTSGGKDTFYVCTFTIDTSAWTMTVTSDKMQSKTVYVDISLGGNVSIDQVVVLYDSQGKPTGFGSIEKLIIGEGMNVLTGSSSVEEKGDNVYVITFTADGTGEEIKLQVTATGSSSSPNFNISLYTE